MHLEIIRSISKVLSGTKLASPSNVWWNNHIVSVINPLPCWSLRRHMCVYGLMTSFLPQASSEWSPQVSKLQLPSGASFRSLLPEPPSKASFGRFNTGDPQSDFLRLLGTGSVAPTPDNLPSLPNPASNHQCRPLKIQLTF